MPTKTSASRKTLLGLVAAALMGSTLLTASTMLPLAASAQAQAQTQIIDPTRSFAPLVERVMPSVVSVQVKIENASDTTPNAQVPEQFRDFFEQFPQFRDQFRNPPQRREGMAQGSGFVISSDGYVVTSLPPP